MAIVKEFYKTREDGINLYKTYSNENKVIKQEETGNEYDEAIDVEDVTYTYTETDKYINDDEVTEEDYLEALSKLGVE